MAALPESQALRGWRRWPYAVSDLGARAGDHEDERLRKAILNWFGIFVVLGAGVDAVPAMIRGQWIGAGLSLTNSAIVLFGMVAMARSGERRLFQRLALGSVLVLPAAMHVAMGGFNASTGLLLWSIFAPLGALLLCSRAEAGRWFVAYLVVAFCAWLVEVRWPEFALLPPSPDAAWSRAGIYVGLPGMAVALVWVFAEETARAKAEAQRESARAERLLLNILPAPIAARLKADDHGTIADGYAAVSVLFADIVGFTALSARTSPERLVALLDDVFSAFDRACDRHGCEKIKTIGDAYMAAAGLPTPRNDHVDALAGLALDMQTALALVNADHGTTLSVRIGIHTGPVVAGVIGQRKFIYDLWGDTVNTASRMESHGVAGRVQLSQNAANALSARYQCEARGQIEVKGKGPMAVYLLLPS